MLELTIDGRTVRVAPGTSVLEAARLAGATIPTLCHLEGRPGFSSCMLCTVEDARSGARFASCGYPAAAGMQIVTGGRRLDDLRRQLLDLLLSEHYGDCEGPCEVVCPAHIPIPETIRLVRAGRMADAAHLVRTAVPLAGILERICPAPCEKGCRRRQVDAAVAIREICRAVADWRAPEDVTRPATDNNSGGRQKSVGIVGAGPAGLAVAFYLARAGVACTVVDRRPDAGGILRETVPASILPARVLERELEAVWQLGVRFVGGVEIGRDIEFREWRQNFDAVVLCVGQIVDPSHPAPTSPHRAEHPDPLAAGNFRTTFGVQLGPGGIKIDPHTLATDLQGVFAAGDAARFHRMAVRAVGDGRRVAASVLQFLEGREVHGERRRFNCSMGKLPPDDLERFSRRADTSGRMQIRRDLDERLAAEAAARETARCMECDCAARHACRLRELSDKYAAQSNRLHAVGKPPFVEDNTHDLLTHERGKCIRCSICIRLAREKGEPVGLAALGRGMDKHPGPPAGNTWINSCTIQVGGYASHCPTGAISLRGLRHRNARQPPET